jgi:hypothetical protein
VVVKIKEMEKMEKGSKKKEQKIEDVGGWATYVWCHMHDEHWSRQG